MVAVADLHIIEVWTVALGRDLRSPAALSVKHNIKVELEEAEMIHRADGTQSCIQILCTSDASHMYC